MTNFFQHYTLKYTPLSPVNIGADESYEPGNYVIDTDAGALYGFDSRAAIAGLSVSEKKRLLAIVNGRPDDDMLTKVQAFFHDNRDNLLAFARAPIPTAQGVKSLYEKRIGKTAQHEGQGKRVINKLEIDRTFYNPIDGNPLLPGSSIKGAIRTALLDQCNNGNTHRGQNLRNQQLQEQLFQGKFDTDPMRLVAVGDAAWQGHADKPACQVQFAVNRKRKPVVDERGNLRPSMGENLYQLLECIAPHQYQSFHGSLTLHTPQALLKNSNKLPKIHWTMQDIAKACNAFYMGLFWRELAEIKERNYINPDWIRQIENLLENGLLSRLNAGQAFLLRFGRHSGSEALTLDGVRSIRIMQGKGQPSKQEKQPKTWWLAADQSSDKQSLLPFGWVLVEIDPKQADSAVQHWLENNSAQFTDWLQTQLTKQNALQQKARQRLKQEQENLLKQQQIEAEQLQKQQAEQQRLASLSPIEQELEAFLKPIQSQEHDTRLLQELEKGRWQAEDAKIVAQKVQALMEVAGKWMPDFAGTNDKKLKLKERSQKVLKYLQG
ncbi:MAG: RAMP superfamily CRISPR-associated protein [Methylomonas sp.]|jgi:CRISPR-associated protein Csm5|uniref:RAMP superfamily CRISPR-associated protein n=1 Tax=Methylomonas sp. TaxID=418 RepID=UPI0025CDEEAC|nr:RAMP superfamily CRISPR-associated protein [Methylomonas sp.]MCK9607782.1 RAMP superfamily CRISPR-associated protein [Methylomonas sp.]